ncbi:MAG: AmmeMemoRadiSam system protein B, partial [Candidatus Omnitrophica bacterium]|nr:AmmeMemoRadiSam system protein B [Candidatus Omnitrophota bacterium]
MLNKSLLLLLLVFLCLCAFVTVCYSESVKLPVSAGSFYPDDPKELSAMIDGFLAAANPKPVDGDIFALISPHAGYGFSGPTAAFGYKLIKGRAYKTVIILGTSHFYGFAGASVYPRGVFRTPLGDIDVDEDFAQKLFSKKDDIIFDAQAFEKEHSVEVQLPFLQQVLTDFKIVPVVIGDCSLDTCRKFADLLKQAIGDRKDCLIVVSTDMYHGYDYEESDAIDSVTLASLKNMDSEGLYYGLRDNKMQLCGGFSAVTMLILSKELGHDKLFVLD